MGNKIEQMLARKKLEKQLQIKMCVPPPPPVMNSFRESEDSAVPPPLPPPGAVPGLPSAPIPPPSHKDERVELFASVPDGDDEILRISSTSSIGETPPPPPQWMRHSSGGAPPLPQELA